MSMSVKPLADRVVVKPLDTEKEVKKGGIIIPDTRSEEHTSELQSQR